ncbi:MAG: hypothetical protein A2527_12830 [Candidatus Lambdaproteobacteria bacterium RIFOXYD2_FULL_50_16]|uniref:Uncharacterized protein n=1 Tax=Candidatus Lambdaproteobacteria bacterium RIFOXYD2_FULL_50_16 TaxID=1817772 RepID=A0A1F6G9R8_9PROT|nr:MAG: hypothetical protein A2527_12830 [Candidatus Lambdaproteobacteria bacterium RIFOXYD2_FULL_50_16]
MAWIFVVFIFYRAGGWLPANKRFWPLGALMLVLLFCTGRTAWLQAENGRRELAMLRKSMFSYPPEFRCDGRHWVIWGRRTM